MSQITSQLTSLALPTSKLSTCRKMEPLPPPISSPLKKQKLYAKAEEDDLNVIVSKADILPPAYTPCKSKVTVTIVTHRGGCEAHTRVHVFPSSTSQIGSEWDVLYLGHAPAMPCTTFYLRGPKELIHAVRGGKEVFVSKLPLTSVPAKRSPLPTVTQLPLDPRLRGLPLEVQETLQSTAQRPNPPPRSPAKTRTPLPTAAMPPPSPRPSSNPWGPVALRAANDAASGFVPPPPPSFHLEAMGPQRRPRNPYIKLMKVEGGVIVIATDWGMGTPTKALAARLRARVGRETPPSSIAARTSSSSAETANPQTIIIDSVTSEVPGTNAALVKDTPSSVVPPSTESSIAASVTADTEITVAVSNKVSTAEAQAVNTKLIKDTSATTEARTANARLAKDAPSTAKLAPSNTQIIKDASKLSAKVLTPSVSTPKPVVSIFRKAAMWEFFSRSWGKADENNKLQKEFRKKKRFSHYSPGLNLPDPSKLRNEVLTYEEEEAIRLEKEMVDVDWKAYLNGVEGW